MSKILEITNDFFFSTVYQNPHTNEIEIVNTFQAKNKNISTWVGEVSVYLGLYILTIDQSYIYLVIGRYSSEPFGGAGK